MNLTALFNRFSPGFKSQKVLLTILFLFAYAIPETAAQNIQAIEVRDSSFVMGTNFHRIFYVDDYVVYQSQIHYSNSHTTARFDSLKNEMMFEDSLLSTGWKYGYFVYHRDSNYGYRYDPNKLWLTPRITIDSGRKSFAGSMIGGIAETQEMLDFCGEHNIVADIEMIDIQDINGAYERMVKGDVKYRFVIDLASIKK